jgi:hypothetical protein
MQQNFIADKDLGYVQVAAGGVDTAQTVASLFPGGAIPKGTIVILISPEAQALRWRSDGTPPTTTVGYPLAVGAELRFSIAQMPQLRIISSTAGAIVNLYALGAAGGAS